ncbi:MAG: hypothetical protein IJV72_07105, partial [Clostridia bacterium]|nr:hypothetical protein [Clostridia bacterium]
MKKVLAIVLALMMLIPMALAIVPASAVDAASDSYVDLTAEFNTKSYAVGSGFSIAATNNAPAKKNANAAAGTYAVLQYAGSADYNKKDYDLSYNVKLGAENKGETMNHLYWQDWGTTNADGNV